MLGFLKEDWKYYTPVKVFGLIGATILTAYGLYQLYETFTIPDVSGEWNMTNIVTQSEYKSFIDDTITFKLFIEQNEDRVTGRGEKINVNGENMIGKQRTHISFTGTVDSKSLTLHLSEQGSRETSGLIKLKWNPTGGNYLGRFTSTAADSKGYSRLGRAFSIDDIKASSNSK